MDNGRRALLKASASVTMGGIFMANNALSAATDAGTETASINGGQIKGVPPLAGKIGLRLATCIIRPSAAAGIAVVTDDGRVIDVRAAAHHKKIRLGFDPASMLSLIAAGNAGFEQLNAVVQDAMQQKAALPTIDQVAFLSPIPRPDRNIYCVGWNYLDHFEEGKAARADKAVENLPEHPVFFTKGTQTMNGPFDPIPHDGSNANTKDWEAELVVVIGRRGRNISEDNAMNHVFGYAAYNDTTEREIQQKRHGGQWFKGKSLDGHGPMGPWIATAAGVNLDDVRIICRVNGVEKQNASYKQMYFKIPRIIAELSRGLTLEPGDIIATGTPSGVGFARKPPEFLKPGDIVETEIVGVGTIRNPVRAEV